MELTKSICLFGPPKKAATNLSQAHMGSCSPAYGVLGFLPCKQSYSLMCARTRADPSLLLTSPPMHTRPGFWGRFYHDSMSKGCSSFRTDKPLGSSLSHFTFKKQDYSLYTDLGLQSSVQLRCYSKLFTMYFMQWRQLHFHWICYLRDCQYTGFCCNHSPCIKPLQIN